MSKYPRKVGRTASWDEAGNPVVEFWTTPRQVLTGEEARRFLAREDRIVTAVQILCLPLSLVFWTFVGIHNGIEWLYCRLAGER